MKLFPVHISNFKLDGGAMFGVVPKILWQKKYPCDENNYCSWALRSLLFDNGKQRIMIDNGYGDKQDEKFFSFVQLHGGFGLEGALEKYGYQPEDITDMVISHLHYDHCGGGVKNSSTGTGFEMVFPNATYWVSKQQWEWAKNPNKREATAYLEENILPMQESGQLKFIEDNIELYPGFNVRLYDGHTVGQIIPFISYRGKTVVYMADLIPSSAHINLAWNMSYDVQPLITLIEKEQFLKEAYENEYILFLEHDAYNECCTIEKTKKGFRAKETFTLEEYFRES